MSTPTSLELPDRVRRTSIRTARGVFAALEAAPASGVCERDAALLVPGYTGSKEDFLAILDLLADDSRHVVAIDVATGAQHRVLRRHAPGGVAFGSCAFVCRRWGERAAGPIPILIAHDLGRLGCGPFAFRRRPLQRYRVSAQLWNPPMHFRAKV